MGQDRTIATLGETRIQRRTAPKEQSRSSGRHPVDIAHRGTLARPAPTISQPLHLLAATEALGRTRALVKNLAYLPIAVGCIRAFGLGGGLH
jgi:hypothetical protein